MKITRQYIKDYSNKRRQVLVDWFRLKMTGEGLLRMLADAILVNIALIAALVIVLLYRVGLANPDSDISYRTLFWDYLSIYGNNAPPLTLLSIIIFTASGFYTYGRYYAGRYKVLIVGQAVCITYLVFGALSFVSQGSLFPFLKSLLSLSRGAFFIAWGLSIVLLISARLWSSLWKDITRKEGVQRKSQKARMKNVLVIGGAGYIGSALLPKLLEKGYQVRLLDLLLYGTEPIESCLTHPHLEIIQADFRQIDRVVEAMRDIDAVVHLGGIVGDPACELDENLTIDINLMATRMIAEVAKGSGVGRFVFASTCSVYGASEHNLDERSQLNPVSLYARSKIASEKVLQKMASEHFCPVILRLGTIYGLSGRTRFDLVINLLTAKAVMDGEITVFGGDQWRPFLHVDDAARAIMDVLAAPLDLVHNQTFNVGSNEQNYTINQIAGIIQQHVPSAEIVRKGDGADRRNYWVNFNKISRALRFQPSWTVDQGVEQVIDAIQSGRVLDYRDAKYSNVLFLRQEGHELLSREGSEWAYHLLDEAARSDSLLVDS